MTKEHTQPLGAGNEGLAVIEATLNYCQQTFEKLDEHQCWRNVTDASGREINVTPSVVIQACIRIAEAKKELAALRSAPPKPAEGLAGTPRTDAAYSEMSKSAMYAGDAEPVSQLCGQLERELNEALQGNRQHVEHILALRDELAALRSTTVSGGDDIAAALNKIEAALEAKATDSAMNGSDGELEGAERRMLKKCRKAVMTALRSAKPAAAAEWILCSEREPEVKLGREELFWVCAARKHNGKRYVYAQWWVNRPYDSESTGNDEPPDWVLEDEDAGPLNLVGWCDIGCNSTHDEFFVQTQNPEEIIAWMPMQKPDALHSQGTAEGGSADGKEAA